VDYWVPGCPPSAKTILEFITDLLEGRKPETPETLKFG
jgi:coenzyme F420-reducing hydrogenase gamma subunit